MFPACRHPNGRTRPSVERSTYWAELVLARPPEAATTAAEVMVAKQVDLNSKLRMALRWSHAAVLWLSAVGRRFLPPRIPNSSG